MAYGTQAKRVPARGKGGLSDVDIYKLGIIGRTERGFSGVIHKEIYSWSDYSIKCGQYREGADYIGYVTKSFLDELNINNPVELKVLGYVASDAVQATYSMLDQNAIPSSSASASPSASPSPLASNSASPSASPSASSTPASGTEIFEIAAGRLNVADESAFGNKIAVKVGSSMNVTMKLTADTAATPVIAYLDSVSNLVAGNYVQFYDSNALTTEVAIITAISTANKTISFAALTNTYSATYTTVSRIDVDLDVAVKDAAGNYELKEKWSEPMAFSSTIGIAGAVNNTVNGSNYIIMTHNASNATADPGDQVPYALTAWTALTSGADGTNPVDADWNTLLTDSFIDTDITFLLAPESSSTTHNQNMAAWATSGYKCMYYAQSSSEATEANLKNEGSLLRKGITFSMMPSDKWVEIDDPIDGGKVAIPKVGIDAAFWFNTYAKYGESKVAAGNKSEMVLNTSARLLDSNGLVHDDILGVGGRMIEKYGVNICRFRRGLGITNNSARTLSTDKGYIYQNQVMQFLLYKKSIVTYLQSIEQDRGGVSAQNSHYRAVRAYMSKKFKAGHLAIVQKEDGSFSTFNDVCIIVNDFSINTLADLANGIEQMFFQFVSPPPIESPILSIASAAVTAVSG